MKSKQVPNEELRIINKNKKTEVNVDLQRLTEIATYNKNMGELNDDVFSLFPNIKIAIEIMTSSILSPNTMTGEDYNLTIKNKILPLDIAGSIVNIIKEHIDNNYGFKDKLYKIIEETIYTKGSYCEIILPPDLITDLYSKIEKREKRLAAGVEEFMSSFDNVSMNSFINSRNLNRDMKAIDNKYKEAKLLTINENYTYFIRDKVIENLLNNNYNYGIDSGLEDAVVVDKILMLDDTIELENEFKIAFNKKIPSESILPISDKDDPHKHYGYFVFLNNTGTPINKSEMQVPENANLINFGLASDNKKVSDGEKLIKKAQSSLSNITKKAPELNNRRKLVENLIAAKIQTTMKNSLMKDLVNYDIELNKEMTELIYKKIESNEKVNIVFVPNKYLMYYAIDYRDNGTGKSILEDILLLTSVKATLFLARIAAYIKSSIVVTDIKLELDEDDPDPDRTLAKVLNYVKKSRQMQLPIGMMKVNDLVDWLHNVGFKITAEHPRLPRFNLDYEENLLNSNPPPDDLEELLEKYISLSLGVTPEMVDNSYSPDFATTIVANNVLMTRRIFMKQKMLNPLLSKHIRKYIENDPILYNKIKTLIEDNLRKIKKKISKSSFNTEIVKKLNKLKDSVMSAWVMKEVLKTIDVNLPKPELQDDDPNAELFDKLSSKLDNVLDVILSDDMFDSELLGDLADKVENQKNILKGLITYKWMSQNRFLPEVADIFNVDEDGKPVFNLADEYKTLVEALKANIVPLLKEMNKFKKKSDEQLDKIENGEDEDTSSEDNTSSEESSENDNSESNTSEESGESTSSEENENSEESSSNSKEEKEEENLDNEEDDLTEGLFK